MCCEGQAYLWVSLAEGAAEHRQNTAQRGEWPRAGQMIFAGEALESIRVAVEHQLGRLLACKDWLAARGTVVSAAAAIVNVEEHLASQIYSDLPDDDRCIPAKLGLGTYSQCPIADILPLQDLTSFNPNRRE